MSDRSRLTRFAWLAWAVPGVLVAWLFSGFHLEIPLFDEWSLLPLFEKLSAGEPVLDELFARQNGVHLNLVPKLVFALLAFASGWSIALEVAFNFALVVVTFVMLVRLSAREPGGRSEASRFVANTLTAFLLFSLVQSWNWQWGYALVIFSVNFFLTAAALILSGGGSTPTLRRTLLAAGMCGLATFSHADGALCWIALLPALLLRTRTSADARRALVAWLGLAALAWAVFLIGSESRAAGVSFLASLRTDPLEPVLYYLNLLGIPIGAFAQRLWPGSWGGAALAPFGLTLLIAYAALLASFVRRDGLRQRRDVAAWASIGLFVLLYGAVNTVARVSLGELAVMASSMYASATGLLPIAVVQLAALWHDGAPAEDAANAAAEAPPAHRRNGWLAPALACGLALCIALNLALDLQRLLPLRRESQQLRHCIELVRMLAEANMCRLRLATADGGVPRMAALGFRTLHDAVPFVDLPGPALGGIDAYAEGDWQADAKQTSLRVHGWLSSDAHERLGAAGADPAVFLERDGEGRLFGMATRFHVLEAEAERRIGWSSLAPLRVLQGASASGIRAWLYDGTTPRLLRLEGRLEIPPPPATAPDSEQTRAR